MRMRGAGLVFATIFTELAEQRAQTEHGVAQLLYYHDLACHHADRHLSDEMWVFARIVLRKHHGAWSSELLVA